MPKDLKDFPRPPSDNGRGLHGSAGTGWAGGNEGYDYWIKELVSMGVKWFKVLDDGGDSIPFCEKLLDADIFPIVRILRRDPPPNDSPEPNPGHLGGLEEKTIQHLIAAGVRYFETNNEPNLNDEWKQNAMPSDPVEAAKLVALNWLFDARFILSMGGFPGLPAMGPGSNMDLIAALVALGRHKILLDGCWIAIHNYSSNRPLTYPDDPVNRSGQPLTPSQYTQGAFTEWAWWNTAHGKIDTLDDVNQLRVNGMNPTQTIQQDRGCFREFEHHNALAVKYLGRSIPIISTAGGLRIGRREDLRYPRITPTAHCDQTVAMFDFMQRQAPDYYFAAVPWLLIESAGYEAEAWTGSFWKNALTNGSDGQNNIPVIAVPGHNLGAHLPVVQAIKSMQNMARRLPGVQPAPPVQTAIKTQTPAPTTTTERPPSFEIPRERRTPGTAPNFPSWLHDETEAPAPPVSKPVAPPPPQPRPAITPPPPPPTLRPAAPPPPPAPRPATPPPSRPTVAPSPASLAPKPTSPLPPPPPPTRPPSTSPSPASLTPRPVTPPPPQPRPPVTPPIQRPSPPPPMREIDDPEKMPPLPDTSRPWSPTSATGPEVFGSPEDYPSQPTPPRERVPDRIPTLYHPPVPPPPLIELIPIPDDVEWDWRLDALNIQYEPAMVRPGQSYWKLVRALYQGPDEAGSSHQITYIILDETKQPIAHQRVRQSGDGDQNSATTDSRGQASIPIRLSYAPDQGEIGPYLAWVDGLPSDRISGMGLPRERNVNFVLTWRRETVK